MNEMPRKLGSSNGNTGLIKMDVFFFLHGYCDNMLDPDPQPREGYVGVHLVLDVGGLVDRRRRRRALQLFLLLGKIALA